MEFEFKQQYIMGPTPDWIRGAPQNAEELQDIIDRFAAILGDVSPDDQRVKDYYASCTVMLHRIIKQHLRCSYILNALIDNPADPECTDNPAQIRLMYRDAQIILIQLIQDAAKALYPAEAIFIAIPR